MDYKKFIERNPSVMLGKPLIKGTRITVELVMRKLAGGSTIAELLANYPHLTREQVQAAFDYNYFQRTLFKGVSVKELSKATMKSKKGK
jgi:uncharacterized protein (DUF433 family)